MKRQWQHPKTLETGRQYWRSLGELEETPEFREWLDREFPQGAAELEADDVSRRNFVKLMGAATALAGFGSVGCHRPVRHLVPYNEHVEWVVPGKALYYASAKGRLGGRGCDPLVVTTHEGRPTRVDGNRLHPAVSGGSDAFTQASVLNLYDPDRSRDYLKKGAKADAAAFESEFLQAFRESASGKDVAFLVSEGYAPTRNRLLGEVSKKFAGAKVYGYEPLAAAGLAAVESQLFGEGVVQVPHFDRATKILSLDSDFLGLDKVGEDPVMEFSRGRGAVDHGEEMNRLYVLEPAFTLTGGMADHRYRLAASQVGNVAILIAAELAKLTGDAALAAALKPLLSKVTAAVYNGAWIRECAADLAASKGASLVVAGSRQSEAVHALAAAMNAALGAYEGEESVISLLQSETPALPGLVDLAKAIEAGQVKTLFITSEADPLIDAPADLKLAELFDKVGSVVHLSERRNVTARAATWHVPGAHYLEGWGDWRSASGVYSVQQPMIHPLHGGVSEIEFLLSLLTAPSAEGDAAPVAGIPASDSPALAAVKETHAGMVASADWRVTVRDGFAKGSAFKKVASVAVDAAKVAGIVAAVEVVDVPVPSAIEVSLVAGSSTYDGRFVNNGWMQEAADPITKLTWDNAALMSQLTAEKLGVKNGDLIEITAGDSKVQLPVLQNPGQADATIQVAVGYYGDVRDGSGAQLEMGSAATGVGFSVWGLRTSASPFVISGATVKNLNTSYPLALTSEHYSMEGRAIVREGTVEMYQEDKTFAGRQGMDAHIPENITFYEGPDYANPDSDRNKANASPAIDGHEFRVDADHQWAMVVDLHTCIGCNACSVACQSENNIPIVGKGQVIAGREMHWIRMDRYFSSPYDSKAVSEMGLDFEKTGSPGKRKVDDDNVEMLTQPVACQQCEAAPCETVCPVNATVHTGDGLNAMTYNRCIGTRYCANNCPYKARRFNYFDYNKRPLDQLYQGPLAPAAGRATTTELLQKNPNVTVRMRGVIEKCTYCVQRLSAAKVAAKVAARDSSNVQVPANSVTTACQDACPAGAITFGNWKLAEDKVTKLKGKMGGDGHDGHARQYELLKYIGTRPRTSYLARIKNPNPKMPGAGKVGRVTAD
ncbi:MAG: TAT-variant-translocated molybdopterin oxidoreductase, partial [Verrucomicrobiae bacterium]|nr:TAT-variant-translocated molybdopterin oxidoreductase [Verrucomicrobiae bacterium]